MPGVSLMCPSGAGFCAEYQAVYDAMINPPDSDIAWQQDLMIRTLVNGKVWSKLDWFALFAQQSNAAGEALINWINPGTCDATLVNAPAFVAYEGFTGDGVSAYINSNWNPPIHGVNYTINNASVGVYSRTDSNDAFVDVGCRSGGISDSVYFYTRNSGEFKCRFHEADLTGFATADSLGMHIATRIDANNKRYYKNNVYLGNVVAAVVSLPTLNYYILANNINGVASLFSPRQLSCAFWGVSLDLAEIIVLTNAFETYMDSQGTGIIP